MLSASASSVDSNDAYAGFGQLSYRWPAGLELTMALRYDRDERRQVDRALPAPRTYQAAFDAWQPKVSLSWAATPTSMFYVTAGKGFRSGGFNPQERITRVYRAETNFSEEIGAKLSMLENRVNLTAAFFHTQIDDRQVYTLDVLTSAQTLSNPIPSARVSGVEVDVTARPVPPLEISAAVGATRSRIERYDPSVFAGLPVAGDFTGNRLPQTPELSWALRSQYRMTLSRGLSLTPRIEWTGQAGDYFWEIDNRNRRAALSLVNVRLIVEQGSWSVTAYLENATNERYVLEYLPAPWSGIPAGDIAAAARGRHSGIEASWRF
jgi:iron complex outermembrane recepter protein